MKHAAIRKRFAEYLRTRALKLTPQRKRIFEVVFATHEHFSADTLYGWVTSAEGRKVSRATVYRTLSLLLEGGFIEALDAGRGELVYEHVLGHQHHDHMVCIECGKIEEFYDERIERLQEEACERKGFELVDHDLRLRGFCRACRKKRPSDDGPGENRPSQHRTHEPVSAQGESGPAGARPKPGPGPAE